MLAWLAAKASLHRRINNGTRRHTNFPLKCAALQLRVCLLSKSAVPFRGRAAILSPPHQAAAASLKYQCSMDVETGEVTAKHVCQSLLAICTLSPALQIHCRVVGFPRHRADTSGAVAVTTAGHSKDSLCGNAPRVLCDTGRLYIAWRTTSCCSASSRPRSQRYRTLREYDWQLQFACCIS